MKPTVRRIMAGEWRQYRDLRLEALKDSPLAFVEQYDDALARADRFWQDRVERSAAGRTSGTFVAVHDGKFIGKASCFVEMEITEYVSAQVVGVYVTPRFRGQGVAEALMTAALRWAREKAGAAGIRLFVMQTNERATAFYRRIGFVPTGSTVVYPGPRLHRARAGVPCHMTTTTSPGRRRPDVEEPEVRRSAAGQADRGQRERGRLQAGPDPAQHPGRRRRVPLPAELTDNRLTRPEAVVAAVDDLADRV